MIPTDDAALAGGYIAFEGIDGSGTTTQRDLVLTRLRRFGVDVFEAAQPSHGPVGVLLRRLLKGEEQALDPVAMQVAFAADRIDYSARALRPALATGTFLVSGRCEMSTAVYLASRRPLWFCGGCGTSFDSDDGGAGRPRCPRCEVGDEARRFEAREDIEAAYSWNAASVHPGLVIVVDVPIEIATKRRAARPGAPELFDDHVTQSRARRLYRHEAADAMARDGVTQVEIVDGSGKPEQVHAAVWELVAPFVEQWLQARGIDAVR